MKNALASMTGFARMEGAHNDWRWVWEVKSVNGRGLELRCRLPQGFDSLEPVLRKAAKEKLARGNVNVNLTVYAAQAETRYRLNEHALAEVIETIHTVTSKIECAPPRPDGILALRGVMETVEEAADEEKNSALIAGLVASFGNALDELSSARRVEGDALAKVLVDQFDEIARLIENAAANAEMAPDALKKKIDSQLGELLSGAKIPEERLAQEAALLAIKADVREEVDRLNSHIAAGRALLNGKGPVGRQLDFLIQEFNREANTLCSKASDMDLKRIGLEMKNVIDQMREQVQNIE